ncbi:hypothetical protein ACQJBY_005731 [Aegilops geniculata]
MVGHGAAEVSPEKTKWGRIGRRQGLLAMAPVGIGAGGCGCGCSWVLIYDQVVPSGTSRRRRWVPLLRIEAGGAREAAATAYISLDEHGEARRAINALVTGHWSIARRIVTLCLMDFSGSNHSHTRRRLLLGLSCPRCLQKSQGWPTFWLASGR